MDLGFLKRCVELKIVLDKFCESFSKDKTSRVCNISTKLKILMLLLFSLMYYNKEKK